VSGIDAIVAGMNAAVDTVFGGTVVYTREGVGSVTINAPFSREAREVHARPGDPGADTVAPRLDLTRGILGALNRPVAGDTYTAAGSTWQVERVVYVNESCDGCWSTEVR